MEEIDKNSHKWYKGYVCNRGGEKPDVPCSGKSNDDKLIKEELIIIDLLVDAFNAFAELECYHPCDRSEFAQGIHSLQNMVMARLAVRNHKDVFYKLKENKND